MSISDKLFVAAFRSIPSENVTMADFNYVIDQLTEQIDAAVDNVEQLMRRRDQLESARNERFERLQRRELQRERYLLPDVERETPEGMEW